MRARSLLAKPRRKQTSRGDHTRIREKRANAAARHASLTPPASRARAQGRAREPGLAFLHSLDTLRRDTACCNLLLLAASDHALVVGLGCARKLAADEDCEKY